MDCETQAIPFGKKLIAAIASVALAVSLCPGAALASELQAGSVTSQVAQKVSVQASKNLGQRGAKFDLRAGKAQTIKRYLRGLGNVAYSAKISDLKVADSKPGYKTATFTATFKLKKPLTKKQGQKVLKAFKKAYYDQGGDNGNSPSFVWDFWMQGGLGYWLVDYQTGRNVEAEDNAAGVRSEGKWTDSKVKKYVTADGNWWFTYAGTSKAKVSITFPESYKNLCVGIGGDQWPRIERTKSDENFDGSLYYGRHYKFAGGKPYTAKWWQTSRFKKANSNFHFMRIVG